jgi:hypothetical protein
MIAAEATGIRRRLIALAMIAIAAAGISALGLATSRSVAAGPEAAPSPQAAGYLPSISDLMIATIPAAARADLAGGAGWRLGICSLRAWKSSRRIQSARARPSN